MTEFVEKWSAYILAGLTGIAGVIWGVKRAQLSAEAKLAEMEKDMVSLDRRVQALEAQGKDAAIHLVRIQATLDNVLEYLQDLKSEIRGKADK